MFVRNVLELRQNGKWHVSVHFPISLSSSARALHIALPRSTTRIPANMSRFISAGTDEAPTERDEAWRKAQQELEAKQVQKAEADKQDSGKSLYETLQSNKGGSLSCSIQIIADIHS